MQYIISFQNMLLLSKGEWTFIRFKLQLKLASRKAWIRSYIFNLFCLLHTVYLAEDKSLFSPSPLGPPSPQQTWKNTCLLPGPYFSPYHTSLENYNQVILWTNKNSRVGFFFLVSDFKKRGIWFLFVSRETAFKAPSPFCSTISASRKRKNKNVELGGTLTMYSAGLSRGTPVNLVFLRWERWPSSLPVPELAKPPNFLVFFCIFKEEFSGFDSYLLCLGSNYF